MSLDLRASLIGMVLTIAIVLFVQEFYTPDIPALKQKSFTLNRYQSKSHLTREDANHLMPPFAFRPNGSTASSELSSAEEHRVRKFLDNEIRKTDLAIEKKTTETWWDRLLFAVTCGVIIGVLIKLICVMSKRASYSLFPNATRWWLNPETNTAGPPKKIPRPKKKQR